MTHFKIITAAWNCERYLDGYFESIRNQNLDNISMDVCVVDDASPGDQPWIIKERCDEYGWKWICNDQHRGALYNQVLAIRRLNCDPEDVLVFVDGDDKLAHNQVLQRLTEVYAEGVKLTYGSYRSEPYSPTCSLPLPYPEDIVQQNSYRLDSWRRTGILFNHLRTFKYELFLGMDETDWRFPNGEWFQTGADTAMMIPALELAHGNYRCLREVLYIYTSDNEVSDWRRDPRMVDKVNEYVLTELPEKR